MKRLHNRCREEQDSRSGEGYENPPAVRRSWMGKTEQPRGLYAHHNHLIDDEYFKTCLQFRQTTESSLWFSFT